MGPLPPAASRYAGAASMTDVAPAVGGHPGEADAGGGEERAELRLGVLPATAGDQHLEIEALAEIGTGGTSGIASGAPLQIDGGSGPLDARARRASDHHDGGLMQQRQIAFLIYPDMTPLDLIGPLQVVKNLESFGPFDVVTVGERLEPVPTDVGIAMQAERTFEQVPEPFALVIPGGLAGPIKAIANDRLMAYVRSAGRGAQVLGSVCTGSLILAAAGLLDGRSATTHWTFLDHLGRLGAVPVRKRWVEDGSVITAAGVSAGIDMAIALVARLAGNDVARTIQAIVEYDPEPPLGPIDWRWVDDAKIGPTLLESVTPALRGILAGKPELAAKLFP